MVQRQKRILIIDDEQDIVDIFRISLEDNGFKTDTFVTPGSVNGYGVYQPHNSSIFRPGEKIVLYIEPVGYSYKPIGSMFLMNFTGDLLVGMREETYPGRIPKFSFIYNNFASQK